jgi:pSer/pThr/pTyr-binding forkhead associated (FHA) protein
MLRLVVLSPSLAGRAQDLTLEKTTVGRVEDNVFQLAEPSVSSHHCEILLRGQDVVVRDLNSTNGSYINGEKVTEAVLKPGQVLRLGQVELRLEAGGAPASTDQPPPPQPPAGTPTKKPLDQTMVMQRGVNLAELDQGARAPGFDTKSAGFSKKDNKINQIFIIGGVVLGVIILGLLLYVFLIVK